MEGKAEKLNFHVILKKRPGANGEPKEDDFDHVPCVYPSQCNEDSDEIIVKTMYLSVDPALRCRMNDTSGVDYISHWPLNTTLDGFGGVGEVVETSRGTPTRYNVGDLVYSAFYWPWANYVKLRIGEHKVDKVDVDSVGGDVSVMMSVLGGVGVTTLLALRNKAHIRRGGGQCMVVSAAAGACGILAGQLGKQEGCGEVIGICSSRGKGEVISPHYGYDQAIAYREEDVGERLAALAPSGVDVYFDNVGGEISDAVIRHMNRDGHVILCGQISQYNKDVPYPPPIPSDIEGIIQDRNITRERFLVFNYLDQFQSALDELKLLLREGKIKAKHTVLSGLHNTGNAFVSMMNGGNVGKQLVRIY